MLYQFVGGNPKELSDGGQGPGRGAIDHAELICRWQASLADQGVNGLNLRGRRLGFEIDDAGGSWLWHAATARGGAVSECDRRYPLFTAASAEAEIANVRSHADGFARDDPVPVAVAGADFLLRFLFHTPDLRSNFFCDRVEAKQDVMIQAPLALFKQ